MSEVLALELVAMAQRLYSKASPLPVDVIAAQHEWIHADLERWGAWNRERYQPRRACSAEGAYRRTRAGDQTAERPQLPISLPARERNREVDRAVIRLPMQHRQTVTMFYAEKRSAVAICKAVVVRWADFPRWMFDCRAMVINILRELGV